MGDGEILMKSGKFFAFATERTQRWNEIQQDIIGRVQCKLAYEVTVLVWIFGNIVTTFDVRLLCGFKHQILRSSIWALSS